MKEKLCFKDYQGCMPVWFVLIILTLLMISCSSFHHPGSHLTGYAFTEADPLFRQDPRWMGADAALSVPLSKDRILWLFGDTFIATSNSHTRAASKMVRNTIAIQTGTNPGSASIIFHWRKDSDGSPAPFFSEQGEHWYWPGHGIRLSEGPLVIFLYTITATPDQGLGFAVTGYAVAIINNPDKPAETWNPQVIDAAPNTFDAIPATAVVRDGAYVVALAIRQEGKHAGYLVRYPVNSLIQGDVTTAEWWTGGTGWVQNSKLGKDSPMLVLDDAGSECSIHWDEDMNSFIHIASYGFGSSIIGLRTAPLITGPWSPPIEVYRPPESDGPRPFVYAAKAHPELTGPESSDLIVTYATNSFDFADLFTTDGEKSLYWPRFVIIRPGR